MSYTLWNKRFLELFFSPANGGREVRLSVSREFLDAECDDLGGYTGFLKAMNDGPEWPTIFISGNHYHHRTYPGQPELSTMRELGLRLYRQYRPKLNGGQPRPPQYPQFAEALRDPPPYLAYLCLLCLAWTDDTGEHVAAHAYYPRMDDLFPNHGLTNQLSEWQRLWAGLRGWANNCMQGRYGLVNIEPIGMAHVGIPKAQVPLLPRHINHLDEIFSSCGFAPGQVLDSAAMRQAILESPRARTLLGNGLVKRITDGNSDFGSAAIDLLRGYLKDWSGTDSDENGQAGGGQGWRRIRLGLAFSCNGQAWVPEYVFRDPRGPVVLDGHGWRSEYVDSGFSLLVDEQGNAADATGFVDFPAFCGQQNSQEHGEDIPVRLSLSDAPIRFLVLQDDGSNRLVECDGVPEAENAYLLSDPEKVQDCLQFFNRQGVQVAPQQQAGLPGGWQLYFVLAIRSVPLDTWRELDAGLGDAPRLIRLEGGTRTWGAGKRRYLPYDLPVIILQADDQVTLEITGPVQANEIQLQPAVQQQGQARHRHFCLTSTGEDAVVSVCATRQGLQVGRVINFTISNEMPPGMGANCYRIDQFGQGPVPDGQTGCSGAILDLPPIDWEYPDLPELPDGIDFRTAAAGGIFEGSSFRFIHSLAGQSIPYGEYKGRAARIARLGDAGQLMEETMWLRDLGFVELQTARNGIWARVHANRLQLYALPWKCNGRFQAVLTGCDAPDKIRRLCEDALTGNIECVLNTTRYWTKSAKLSPPRICFRATNMEDLAILAACHDVPFLAFPPAIQIARWAGCIQKWLSGSAACNDGACQLGANQNFLACQNATIVAGSMPNWDNIVNPPASSRYYLPRFFRFATSEAEHEGLTPVRLALYQDGPIKTNYLIDTRLGNNRSTRSLGDFAWAIWRSQYALRRNDSLEIPYDRATGCLAVPFAMTPPAILSRALALCSGLPGVLQKNSRPFMEYTRFMPDGHDDGYNGSCRVHGRVPPKIAEIVFAKLKAAPCNVQSIAPIL